MAGYTTIHLIVALVASQGWTLHQMYVKSAFLHGLLQEEVYVEQPPGFEVYDRKTHVCRLKKALYRLMQAPRAWYARIDNYLISWDSQRAILIQTCTSKRSKVCLSFWYYMLTLSF